MKENPYYNSRGGSRAWKKLRDRVLREEPTCRIGLPGICTVVSTEVNHLIPKVIAPDLVMVRSNCQGSCRACNRHIGKRSRAAAARSTGGSTSPARALAFFE